MALRGFLEAIEPFQVRGWVCDPERLDASLIVEICCGDTSLGTATANLYRADLDRDGIGEHAFVLNFNQRLDPARLGDITASVVSPGGARERLRVLPRVEAQPILVTPELEFEGLAVDETQQPVFVLGAARSGTSAMAQALLKLGRYDGYQEGHAFDLLAHFSVSLRKFYGQKSDDGQAGHDTMISKVREQYFQRAIDGIGVELARRLFSSGRWIDKTPNSDMIYLAPRFRKIWPNAKFIFMKRRFLENAVSRSHKFPSYNFAHNCREWSEAMSAWMAVRPELAGAAVEVDQRFLSDHPEDVAARLEKFLPLDEIETKRLAQALAFDRPERTSGDDKAPCNLPDMGWADAEMAEFARYCADPMRAFGYDTTNGYFLPGCEENGFVTP